jgi:hypothetical protein
MYGAADNFDNPRRSRPEEQVSITGEIAVFRPQEPAITVTMSQTPSFGFASPTSAAIPRWASVHAPPPTNPSQTIMSGDYPPCKMTKGVQMGDRMASSAISDRQGLCAVQVIMPEALADPVSPRQDQRCIAPQRLCNAARMAAGAIHCE